HGRVDGRSATAALMRAPSAIRVEVVEREADRIHDLVTAGARRILAMDRHLIAQREHLARILVRILEGRDVWRRLWRRRAEDVLEHPDTALDGGRPEVLRPRDRQEAP